MWHHGDAIDKSYVISMSFYSNVLTTEALQTMGDCPPRANQLLVIAKNSPSSISFIYKLTNPDNWYLPFHGNHNKSSCPHFPPTTVPWWLQCFLMWPCVARRGPVCPFLFGTVSNKLSFQGQLSPDLLASPYLNNNKTYILFFFNFYFFFWSHCTACRILVPRPGIEPRPTAVKVLSPNHWTTREFP